MNDGTAKSIFQRYGGDHGEMARDGVFAEYQAFGIRPEIEAIWLEELISELMGAFTTHWVVDEGAQQLFRILRRKQAIHEMRTILSAAAQNRDRIDDFSSILIAEAAARFQAVEQKASAGDMYETALSILPTAPPFRIATLHLQKGYLLPELTDAKVAARVDRCRKNLEDLMR